MVAEVTPVTFPNRDRKQLFGTLHIPASRASDVPLIVLLSPGVKMRVGPHRLYNRMTERFNDMGFAVFKFDFVGLGDSEGELDRELLAEVYNDTETGAFVNDSVDALNWLQSEYHFSSFILGGLCGGAITALLAAQTDDRVLGLISLGMTTTLAMGARDRTKFASQGELAALRKGYLARALDIKSWLRLLSFQSDFNTMFRAFKEAIVRKNVTPSSPTQNDPVALSNANPLFPPAFFDITRSNRPILMIFSGADRLYWDFDEKFAQPYAEQLSEVSGSYELHIVENANHVFSFREWEQSMLQSCTAWLTKQFGLADGVAKP